MRRAFSLALLLVVACGRCSACREDGTVVEGPTPYVRCDAASAPKVREGVVGLVKYRLEDRTLVVEAPRPLVLAAFRGAGSADEALGDAMLGVKEHAPGLVFVLGELGETKAEVKAHLDAFAALGALVVVIPSGVDVASSFHEAFAESTHANVLDGRGLRALKIGDDVFSLLGGAPSGRYAASDEHCGFADADVEALAEALPAGRRWLVTWAAPSGGGEASVGIGLYGEPAGSAEVAAVMERIGAHGGLFAFPATRVLRPTDVEGTAPLGIGTTSAALRLVVPRIAGDEDLLDDGARSRPAAAFLELRDGGLAYTGTSVSVDR